MASLNQREKYLFNIKNYKITKEINRGGFGVVNLVKEQKTGDLYAAKTNLIKNDKLNKLFISREVRILIQVQHPTIIQFRGFSYVDFENKKNTTILMDYMKNGSLADLIAKEEKGLVPSNYTNTNRQIILIGIARGMMLLHKLHIIHRDLKPENILLDDDFRPHISDFGLSKFFDPNRSTSQSMADVGTVAYMAPEVIKSDRFGTKADVYSFGILMYELLSAKRAYKNLLKGKKKITTFDFKQRVCDGMRPEIEKGSMKKSLQKMIEMCLLKDPKERPTFSELYKKLSLSNEYDFLDFNTQAEKSVINYEEEDNNDNDDDEDEMGIDKTFCIDSVDYEEVLNYVDDISEEPTRYNEMISTDKEARIKLEEQEEVNKKLKAEIENLKKSLIKSTDEIEALKKNQSKQIEKMATEMKSLKTNYDKEISKLKDEITQLKGGVSSKPKLNVIEFTYNKGNEFNGICKYLSTKVGDNNIHDQGLVNITTNSVELNNPLHHPKYLVDYKNETYYSSGNVADIFICFDFKDRRIQLSCYSLKSWDNSENGVHIRNWVIECSNDNITYLEVDRRNEVKTLNKRKATAVFNVNIKRNEFYRYVRLRQTGYSWDNYPHTDNYFFYLYFMELFGKLQEP